MLVQIAIGTIFSRFSLDLIYRAFSFGRIDNNINALSNLKYTYAIMHYGKIYSCLFLITPIM